MIFFCCCCIYFSCSLVYRWGCTLDSQANSHIFYAEHTGKYSCTRELCRLSWVCIKSIKMWHSCQCRHRQELCLKGVTHAEAHEMREKVGGFWKKNSLCVWLLLHWPSASSHGYTGFLFFKEQCLLWQMLWVKVDTNQAARRNIFIWLYLKSIYIYISVSFLCYFFNWCLWQPQAAILSLCARHFCFIKQYHPHQH